MKSKLLLLSSFVLFTSCELMPSLNKEDTAFETVQEPASCVWKTDVEGSECEIEYWLTFWSEIEDISWPKRKEKIDSLSEQETDVMRKILLSQGKSTPFQARLRAQGWVESILPKLSKQLREFILVALYQPSQSLLEMESALVTLSKINTHQSVNIDELKILLNQKDALLMRQQSQIDQLLNIEASIIQSVEEEKE